MQKYDYLIIGGGIAGVTAAETLREQRPDASIGILCAEPHPLYSKVLLPSYLKGRINREKLFLRNTDDFLRRRIDLHLLAEVVDIDMRWREVRLENHLSYYFDTLLIASGGSVKSWGTADTAQFVYRLHTLDDADHLFDVLTRITAPCVVGSSLIGMEFLEIFALNGIPPKLLSREPHYFSQCLDPQGSAMLVEQLSRRGVECIFGDSVREVTRQEAGMMIDTHLLRQFPADAIAVGVGLDRNMGFLKSSGIALGERGVLTNEYLETNIKGVYAAGDVAEVFDTRTQQYRTVGNWTNSFLQGRLAGLNMSGERGIFRQVPSYSIMNFGLQFTVVGDCDSGNGVETIVRMDAQRLQYERFFLREGTLRGAVLVNRFGDKQQVIALIERGTPITAYRAALATLTFDIHSISPV